MRYAIVVFGLLLATAPAHAGEQVERVLALEPDGLVRVVNVKGEIRIEGWDRDEVRLTGEVGEGSRELEIDSGPRRVRIEVSIPRNARAVEDSLLFLRVPRGAAVEAESVSADISIGDLTGRSLEARSVSGDIDLEGAPESLNLRTVSGDIDVDARTGRTRLNSVSGDMDVVGVSGDLLVTTVSGEVLVRARALVDARFESVSGDVELTTDLADDGDLVIESLSGDVELALPASLSARCEAESFSGRIRSDEGRVETARHGPQKRLEFTTGDGSGRIRIESFSGDVRIRTR